ncbi:MAG: hypothetical protein EXS49_02055 [Candidatus Pacebacteria bacterium]|nr:hypothetical protein [Candidatus Paceibacterota bacterium]
MNRDIEKEKALEIIIQNIKSGKLNSDDFSDDQELKELSNIVKSLIVNSKENNPPETYLQSIISEIKNSVTENSNIRYNAVGGLGRSSNPNKWEVILNFMNKTKILIPAGLVILVLVITGINMKGSEDISVLNREFQGIEELDSEFSDVIDQEIDNGDISTYLSSNSSPEDYSEEINIEADGAEINSIELNFNSLIDEENETNAISSSF